MFSKKIHLPHRLSHRIRLSIVTSAFAGLLLLLVFIVAGYEFYLAEMNTANDELGPAVQEAESEYRLSKLNPYLNGILEAHADLSVAVFNREGDLINRGGNLPVPLFDSSGEFDISGKPAMVMVRQVPSLGITIEAAVGWTARERAIRTFVISMAVLWPSLILMIAAITWFASRSTFEPLERLARQAEALSIENLHARLYVEAGEYGQFAERLNRFLNRLERSVRREERFVADAAHELRTPLTVMKGRLETTLLRNRNPEEYRETLKEVLSETERLAGLVEMLLQSATLLQEDVVSIDVEEQLERAHARWVDSYDKKSVTLELESAPCLAKIKPREFEAIVDNLLSNALKASPPRSTCHLKGGPSSLGSRIEVRDEGVGIPPEEAEAVFERFTRLDEGRTRYAGGFGIGLSVCRRIVEGRGGTVYLEPSTQGAHFVVNLPA
jgi:signal transduction histidine kinase